MEGARRLAVTVRDLTPNAGEELSEFIGGVETRSAVLCSLADQMLKV
ncbi:MAG: hypothetical protein ACYC6J_07110 [Coriobacteriia bacterium]